ncbi:hypothetical protein [Maricaulis sp.]|uniref:hypothetical protein n=1 Tax=Maricaulis sp. TaxID=1486257 RepID=UPI0025BFC292|nr:hypothetical protein [Maricaulis sp.]
MGIVYESLGGDGLISVTLVGLASRTEHASAEEQARRDISSGRLKALIVDASGAEVPANQSISLEIWEDFLCTLGARPFAYLPPVGHQSEARDAMIAELVEEWGARFRLAASVEDARQWCLAEIAAGGTGPEQGN